MKNSTNTNRTKNQKKEAIDKIIVDCLRIFPETITELDAYEKKYGLTERSDNGTPNPSFIFESEFWKKRMESKRTTTFAMAARFDDCESRADQETIIRLIVIFEIWPEQNNQVVNQD